MPDESNPMPEEEGQVEEQTTAGTKVLLFPSPPSLPPPSFQLKYFFTAFYNDGTYFHQDVNDVSVQDSKRSSFYDVDQSKIVGFSLADRDNAFVVDLTDGRFIVNGVPFRMHAEDEALPPFRLIFWRRHWQTINTQTGEETHRMVYRFGWQALNAKGENVQKVMELE